jgi:multidrug efflux pump subunit AcrA (membrane-fusion protein)
LRNNGSFVFRINDENKAQKIRVEIGVSSGELVGVTGPLLEGDRVAIRGAENLREGADVKIMLSKQSASSLAAASDG